MSQGIMTRRDFLLGAAAVGLGGWRLFAAPLGWKHGGRPNLVFGVVSDTHLRTRHGSRGRLPSQLHILLHG